MGTALLSGHQAIELRRRATAADLQGLGEMGFGLPGAIGASFALDRGEVMCLNCDGGMMMNLQELQTMVHHQLPIKLFIFNNDGYLMIKHTQKASCAGALLGHGPQVRGELPDFTKLAKAFDLPSWQIRTWEDFDEVLAQAQTIEGPVSSRSSCIPSSCSFQAFGRGAAGRRAGVATAGGPIAAAAARRLGRGHARRPHPK